MKRVACILALLTSAACAAPAPYPLKVDWSDPYGPTLPLYRSAARTVRATFASGTNATDLTGWTPYMSVSTSSTASAVTTAAVSVVSAGSGVVDFTFSGINLAPGWYFYEAGASSGGTTVVARTGRVAMRGSPFAAGATAWSTNFPIASYTWVGTFPTSAIPWSFLSGVYLTAESDPYWLAASNGVTVNAANGAAAYGWGNHATNGYLTSYAETDPNLPAHTNLTLAGGAHGGELDPVWAAVSNTVTANAADGATAYSWGRHDTNGYLTAEADTNALAALGVHTNLPLASSGHGPEIDPSWAAASGSVLYAESDPVWTAASNDYARIAGPTLTRLNTQTSADFDGMVLWDGGGRMALSWGLYGTAGRKLYDENEMEVLDWSDISGAGWTQKIAGVAAATVTAGAAAGATALQPSGDGSGLTGITSNSIAAATDAAYRAGDNLGDGDGDGTVTISNILGVTARDSLPLSITNGQALVISQSRYALVENWPTSTTTNGWIDTTLGPPTLYGNGNAWGMYEDADNDTEIVNYRTLTGYVGGATNGFIQGADVPGYETDTNALAALGTHTNLPIATSGHGPELDPKWSAVSNAIASIGSMSVMTKTAAQSLTSGAFSTVTWEANTNAVWRDSINDLSMSDLVNDRFVFATAGTGRYAIVYQAWTGGDSTSDGGATYMQINQYKASYSTTNTAAYSVFTEGAITTPRYTITGYVDVSSTNDWINFLYRLDDADAPVEQLDARTFATIIKIR